MRRSIIIFFYFFVALAGCARAAEPGDTALEPIARPRVAPRATVGCVATSPEELTDPCRAGGVDTSRTPLSAASAADIGARVDRAWHVERWAECGELYTEISEIDPDESRRREASDAAVLCLNNALAQGQDGESAGDASSSHVDTAARREPRGSTPSGAASSSPTQVASRTRSLARSSRDTR